MDYTIKLGKLDQISAIVERRSAVRFPMVSAFRVRHCVSASEEWMVVQGLNLSDCGVAFLASQPVRVGMLLQVELPKSRSTAIGPVRSCQRRGSKWRVGVQLANPFLSMS